MFIIAGIAAIVITLTIVSFHAIKTTLANPVRSFRME